MFPGNILIVYIFSKLYTNLTQKLHIIIFGSRLALELLDDNLLQVFQSSATRSVAV